MRFLRPHNCVLSSVVIFLWAVPICLFAALKQSPPTSSGNLFDGPKATAVTPALNQLLPPAAGESLILTTLGCQPTLNNSSAGGASYSFLTVEPPPSDSPNVTYLDASESLAFDFPQMSASTSLITYAAEITDGSIGASKIVVPLTAVSSNTEIVVSRSLFPGREGGFTALFVFATADLTSSVYCRWVSLWPSQNTTSPGQTFDLFLESTLTGNGIGSPVMQSQSSSGICSLQSKQDGRANSTLLLMACLLSALSLLWLRRVRGR